MSAFAASQIPLTTRLPVTVEQMLLWCAYILLRFTVKKTFLRRTGLPEEPICSVEKFTDADGNKCIQVFIVLPEIDSAETALADWKRAGEVAATVIPTSFSG
jgi:hypothetical protein